MENCDVCGKDTVMEDGVTFVQGITLELLNSFELPERAAFLQRQLGGYEIGRKYIVCWECLSEVLLGFRPVEVGEYVEEGDWYWHESKGQFEQWVGRTVETEQLLDFAREIQQGKSDRPTSDDAGEGAGAGRENQKGGDGKMLTDVEIAQHKLEIVRLRNLAA